MAGSDRYFGVYIWAGIFTVTALVCLAVGFQMKRGGLSTKPIWWFAGFMVLIGAPQLLFHLWSALRPEPAAASFASEKEILGNNIDPDLVSDVRPAFGSVFAEASQARMGVRRQTGESVIAARFADSRQAARAVGEYLRFIGATQVARPAAGQGGTFAPRAGDVIVARAVGPWFVVWSGASESQIAARQREIGLGPGNDAEQLPKPVLAVLIPLLVILAVVYFFKGAAWAGRIDPEPISTPISSAELAARLEALNLQRESDGRWSLTWSPTPSRRQKMALAPDAANHTVRVTDYLAANYSTAASVDWRSMSGVVFFQTGSHDRLKQPVIKAVTAAGWRWQPVIWSAAPPWLGWLTE